MTTKNYICILAGATLLVSCAPTTTNTTTTAAAARPTPTPRPGPRLPVGKRTETQTGTVIGLTATQIKLHNSAGTWTISRTDGCTTIDAGTLALGNTVTITFCVS